MFTRCLSLMLVGGGLSCLASCKAEYTAASSLSGQEDSDTSFSIGEIQVSAITTSTAVISWSPVELEGQSVDVEYRLEVAAEDDPQDLLAERDWSVDDRVVQVDNLKADTSYIVRLKFRLDPDDEVRPYPEAIFRTNAEAAEASDETNSATTTTEVAHSLNAGAQMQINSITDRRAFLAWDAATSSDPGANISYRVMASTIQGELEKDAAQLAQASSGVMIDWQSQASAVVTALSPATLYYFRVVARDSNGSNVAYPIVSQTTASLSAPTTSSAFLFGYSRSFNSDTSQYESFPISFSWTAADDAETSAANMKYHAFIYFEVDGSDSQQNSSSLDSVDELFTAYQNGLTAATPKPVGTVMLAKTVTGVTTISIAANELPAHQVGSEVAAWVNVVAEDEDGNRVAYIPKFPHCFLAGTKITMANGEAKNIEDIRPGDFVLSRNPDGSTSESEVGDVSRRLVGAYLEVNAGGSVFRVTPEHPFLDPLERTDGPYAGYRRIGSFGVGEDLFRLNRQDGYINRIPIDSIRRIESRAMVYNLHLNSEPHNFFAEGFAVHNK